MFVVGKSVSGSLRSFAFFLGVIAFTEAFGEELDDGVEVYLSPFYVSGKEDDGYLASDSVLGSGVRERLSQASTEVDVFTRKAMDDLGAVEVLAYSTGYDSGNQSMRGLDEVAYLRDYLPTQIPINDYNTERIEVGSGSNYALWGFHRPYGIVSQQLARARLDNDFGEGKYWFGRTQWAENLQRYEIDFNQVAIDERLAFRVMGLDEDSGYENDGVDQTEDRSVLQGRAYVNVVYEPWMGGRFVASYEKGSIEDSSDFEHRSEPARSSYLRSHDFDAVNASFEQGFWNDRIGVKIEVLDEGNDSINRSEHVDYSVERRLQGKDAEKVIGDLRSISEGRTENGFNAWKYEAFGEFDFQELFGAAGPLGGALGRQTISYERLSNANDYGWSYISEEFVRDGEVVDWELYNQEESYEERSESVRDRYSIQSEFWDRNLTVSYGGYRESSWGSIFEGDTWGFVLGIPESWIDGWDVVEASIYFRSSESVDSIQVWDFGTNYDVSPRGDYETEEMGVNVSAFNDRLRLRISHFIANRLRLSEFSDSILRDAFDSYLFLELDTAFRARFAEGSEEDGLEESIREMLVFVGTEIDFNSGELDSDREHKYYHVWDRAWLGPPHDWNFYDSGFGYGNLIGDDTFDESSSGLSLKIDYNPNRSFGVMFNVTKMTARRSFSARTIEILEDFRSAFDDPRFEWWPEFEEQFESYRRYRLLDEARMNAADWIVNLLARYEVLDGPYKGLSFGVRGTWDLAPGERRKSEVRYTRRDGFEVSPSQYFVEEQARSLGIRIGYEKEMRGRTVAWDTSLFLNDVQEGFFWEEGNWSLRNRVRW